MEPTTTITTPYLEVGDILFLPVTGVRVHVEEIEPPVGYPGRIDYRINRRLYLRRDQQLVVKR